SIKVKGGVLNEGEHGLRRKQERYGSTPHPDPLLGRGGEGSQDWFDSTPHPDPLLGRGAEGNRLGCQLGRLETVGTSLSQAMKSKYCYWSACAGAYGALMAHCVSTPPDYGEKVERS